MSTKAYYHPRDIEIDLADLPAHLYNEIASLHGHIKPPPANPVLTCMGNGEPMYVYRHQTGRYFARHYPNGNPTGHGHVIATMSSAHRRQAEYVQRAAELHGAGAQLEVSTGGGTRLDVAIYGNVNTGIEIQRSGLSRAAAKTRATKSFKAGWPTAWVTDREKDPDWADHVPTARLETRGGWDERLPEPNTARVIIGDFYRERDSSTTTGWRYQRQPKSVLLDQLAYLMPAGEIVTVATGLVGKVSLAFKSSIDIIESCVGRPGAAQWNPNPKTPRYKESVQAISVACHAAEVTICCYCGTPVAAAFRVDAHYDCARTYGTEMMVRRRA